MIVTRVCKRTHKPTPYDVYIGRGSVFGNPFSHLESQFKIIKVATRQEAITRHELWTDEQLTKKSALRKGLLQLLNRLKKGQPVYLVCYCPDNCSCHGDYYRSVLVDAYKRWQADEAKKQQASEEDE